MKLVWVLINMIADLSVKYIIFPNTQSSESKIVRI
jgi:hypothetical protein